MMPQQDFTIELWVSVLVSIALSVVMVWAYVRIVQKAGYSGWNVLWMFVPIVNIVMMFYFAFAEWPVTVRLRELEAQVFGERQPPTLARPS